MKPIARTSWRTVADSPVADHAVSVETFEHDSPQGPSYEIAVRVDAHLTLDEIRALITDLQHHLSLTADQVDNETAKQ